MKRNFLLNVMLLSLCALLFSGCLSLRDMHEDAMASVDLSDGRYHGDSPINTSHQTPGENIQWLMIEPFFTQTGTGSTHVSHFDQPDPLGEAPAGGPSDGTRQGNYSFMHPRVAPPATGYFALSEGIEFVGKGFRITPQAGSGGNGHETDHLYYLEIPILVNYIMPINGNHDLRLGAGPYIAAGLFGHYSDEFEGQSQSGSLKFGSDKDYTRMDYGLVLNASYMVCPKVSIGLNFDLGLRNINTSPDDKIYNQSVGLSVGYRIK